MENPLDYSDKTVLVVEQPQDILAFERSGEYRGRYHVLHGVLSPLEGVGPDQLRIKELISRLEDGRIEEIIVVIKVTDLRTTFLLQGFDANARLSQHQSFFPTQQRSSGLS